MVCAPSRIESDGARCSGRWVADEALQLGLGAQQCLPAHRRCLPLAAVRPQHDAGDKRAGRGVRKEVRPHAGGLREARVWAGGCPLAFLAMGSALERFGVCGHRSADSRWPPCAAYILVEGPGSHSFLHTTLVLAMALRFAVLLAALPALLDIAAAKSLVRRMEPQADPKEHILKDDMLPAPSEDGSFVEIRTGKGGADDDDEDDADLASPLDDDDVDAIASVVDTLASLLDTHRDKVGKGGKGSKGGRHHKGRGHHHPPAAPAAPAPAGDDGDDDDDDEYY